MGWFCPGRARATVGHFAVCTGKGEQEPSSPKISGNETWEECTGDYCSSPADKRRHHLLVLPNLLQQRCENTLSYKEMAVILPKSSLPPGCSCAAGSPIEADRPPKENQRTHRARGRTDPSGMGAANKRRGSVSGDGRLACSRSARALQRTAKRSSSRRRGSPLTGSILRSPAAPVGR